MNPAAPDGAPPQRISARKHMGKHRTAPPCLKETLRREAIMPRFIDFSWFGCEHSAHVSFYKARILPVNKPIPENL
jgi:hypothetical protein